MGRRGNGKGSIRRRSDGRWEARISLNGGHTKSAYGKTRAEEQAREHQEALAKILRQLGGGLPGEW